MDNTTDPYGPLRNFIPANSRLGFVFGNPGSDQVVFYVNGARTHRATFDGSSLTETRYGVDAWDDGMNNEEVGATAPPDWNMFSNQFRPISPTDDVLIGLLTGFKPQGRDSKVAIGIDLVFYRTSTKGDQIFDRLDWALGDEIINLLKEYPVMTGFKHDKNVSLQEKNIEHVLQRMESILINAPNSRYAQKIVASTWETLQRNLEIVMYHDTLAPLYNRVCQASRDYMLGSV